MLYCIVYVPTYETLVITRLVVYVRRNVCECNVNVSSLVHAHRDTCQSIIGRVECVMLSVTRAQPLTVEHVMPRSARAQPRTIFPSDSIISGIR